ncbi:MAG: flagellar hook-basal body complex protein, partial [Clostridia bacterium]|nr:flagellar hook-basal body complex protein [Clostridia bacterium]
VSLGTIDVIHTQGAPQSTGKLDDLMIQGDGFFVLSNEPDPLNAQDEDSLSIRYTRAGAFRFVPGGDGLNYLVNPANGMFVMGFQPDADGEEVTDDYGTISIDDDAKSFSIDIYGYVYYVDSAGEEKLAGQIAIAKFTNPSGLEKVGENMYQYANAAGEEPEGYAGTTELYLGGKPGGANGHGTIIPGALEMSNVELAMEFTDMIVTQRGFQANARIISVSDEMLAELANLKR